MFETIFDSCKFKVEHLNVMIEFDHILDKFIFDEIFVSNIIQIKIPRSHIILPNLL
jgi:hypothetical protein